jgi:uncharacterized lipoprotein YddW (UPF0748 family)
MLSLLKRAIACVLPLTLLCSGDASDLNIEPPALRREFRGGWIASVSNIDWPSKRGLSSDEQKKELVAILDRAVALRLNAVILQVRPSCDALYPSNFEPWSEFLSGEMGKPPHPYYDPLAFAVAEAHKRGLELHAWFNPYRARALGLKTPISSGHISKTKPELVRHYGKYLWLDPGEQGVRDHAVNVIMDVVKRYDVDGIHFDDYFYPYQEKNSAGKLIDFPDEPSWTRYKKFGGKLEKADWRRENVNTLLQRLSREIRNEKPWVKFGLSPFGIWRSGNPPSVKGLDAYSSLYADSRKWFMEGWCDYLAPQLYWNIDAKEQSYPVLLDWWSKQNTKKRHLWPGLSSSRVGSTRGPEEIVNQVRLTRKHPGSTGNLFWSIKSLVRDQKGVGTMLVKDVFNEQALVPASPWMSTRAPATPVISGKKSKSSVVLKWHGSTSESIWLWALQTRTNGRWTNEIIPGQQFTRTISPSSGALPDVAVLTAVNRYGNASPAVFVRFTK